MVGEGYFDENSFLLLAKKVRRSRPKRAIAFWVGEVSSKAIFSATHGVFEKMPMQSTHPSIAEHILYRNHPTGRFFVLVGEGYLAFINDVESAPASNAMLDDVVSTYHLPFRQTRSINI